MARKFLTTNEFAERVRAPEATVRYWRHIGDGPRSVKIGRHVLYDEADVDAWIESHFAEQGGPDRASA
jgi:excisionase family DNA binding protein